MPDIVSKKKRSEIMSRIKSKDSRIEVLFRKSLWKKGFRYSKNSSKYFGKPDVVLLKHKTVIFVDSCFWHGCKKHCRIPSVRKKERDKEVSRHYKKQDWNIFRVWEHNLKGKEFKFNFERLKSD